MEKFIAEEEPTVEELRRAIRARHPGERGRPGARAARRSRTRACSCVLDAVVHYLPSPLDVPPVEGHKPFKEDEHVTAQARRRRAVRGARVQDHVRPLRRAAHVPARLLRACCAPGSHVAELARRTARSASAASCRCTRTTARTWTPRSRATSWRWWASSTPPPATRSATPHKPVVLESISFPTPVISVAVEPKTKADQDKLGTGLAKLVRRGPHLRREVRRRDRPDGDLRHGRAAPRHHRGPPQARVLASTPTSASRRSPTARRSASAVHKVEAPVRPPDRRARASSRTCTSTSSPRAPAAATSSSTRSSAARSRGSTSRRSTRASRRRWTTASSPATPWWTSAPRSSTAPSTRSTRRRWRSRSPAPWS